MKLSSIAALPLAVFVMAASTTSLRAADSFYAQTTATESYSTFVGPTPIPGLVLNLPAESKNVDAVLITLNLPNLTLGKPLSLGSPLAATIQIVAPDAPGGLITAT